MKAIISSIILVSSVFFATGQDTIQHLDYNNANATLTNSGVFFNNPTLGLPGYEIPKGGGVTAINSGMFWLAAKDAQGEVFTTLGGYPGLGTDIDQGPYSTTNAYTDPSYDKAFMVSLCQEEIDNFNLWWECSNGINPVGCENVQQPSSSTLSSIYDWPAHGDINIGQSYFLAPFYDRDGDGNYDPVGQGDYPIIKGCCATYLIQNDAGNTHVYSGTDPIGLEMHYLFYQFGSSDDLYNTTFVDVMAINRGTTDYSEFALGFMVDADLGNPQDDYYGSDSLTNTMIFYNSDNLDEAGYLIDPPAIGVVALERPSTSIMSYGSFPATPAVTWNLLNGLQPNGIALQNPAGNSTKFLLSGDPNDATAWNETSQGYQAGDRRGLNATKQMTFNSGDTVLQSYAIVYSDGGNHLENASNVINLASWAKTFYDTEIDGGCEAGATANNDEIHLETISIYPNPSAGEFSISMPDAQLRSLEIYDLTGKRMSFSEQDYGTLSKIILNEKAPGVYLVLIETDKGTFTKRIIIE